MQTLLQPILRVKMSSDVHERLASLHIPYPPGPKRLKRADRVRERGVLFIHIPKNAGTSITHALYGMNVGHETIRYFQRRMHDLTDFPSFAILRDPVQRFMSAYRYARAGGSSSRHVAHGFRATYMAFGGIDDALDHITHARSPYSIDHIFRPQTWYLTDTHGHIGVDRLFMLDDMARIQDFIRHYTPTPIGHANAGEGQNDETPSADQIARIRQIYRQDYDLIATVRNNRTAMQPDRVLQSRMDRAAFDLA
ncbi:sulfotransferase family 2 domain-containing protein [Komagataeibacter oboediens]|uniref:Sulfotransferase family 2 domain-containing protein n=1 Tax=Komagataeibacter oboediens TaxID=65958 RepID=A0ABS5SK22_9PROT|nr:sulfotransferase family 2 domain-containing protein [Komagataeibacter oboediens]MBL7234662.1 sulfotransferase family 2 domain-containing protein [Komagataeibacter oboediens]MBT0674532.1 sulfotransferase family 2 domain-containing protein [Komagataeibacter oboediens]MBT0677692.1 sulfotransferase family 2 domain-containing protein [Komagataeibacter oboediens]